MKGNRNIVNFRILSRGILGDHSRIHSGAVSHKACVPLPVTLEHWGRAHPINLILSSLTCTPDVLTFCSISKSEPEFTVNAGVASVSNLQHRLKMSVLRAESRGRRVPVPGTWDEGSTLSDSQLAGRLLRALSSLRDESRFCDALLVLDGGEILVQKNILAVASPYIRTMLNYHPPKDDRAIYRIELEGISVVVMRGILDHIFSGQIRLREDTIQHVLQAADLLLLTDLKALEFLEGCIDAENCIGIRDFALHYCLPHLHYLATEYLETHFRDVSTAEEFLELHPQKLKEVISLEKLNVDKERYVLEAVTRWIEQDTKRSKVHMKDLVLALWVSGIDRSYLQEQMLNKPLVRDIVKECRNISLSRWQRGERMLADCKPRGYSGSQKPTAATRCLCTLYNPKRMVWINLAPLSVPRVNHSVLAAGGFSFVFGGQDEKKQSLSSGERYGPDAKTWTVLPPMSEARHSFGIVGKDGMLYVLGGEDGEKGLVSMECYDISSKTWTRQPNLTMVRKIGCYAAMKKKIYATGGRSHGKLFESVECYDPRTQGWTVICPLKEKRVGAVACGVAMELVFGGVRRRENVHGSEMVTCKPEFYHDEFKRWTYLNDHNFCTPSSSSVVYGAVAIGASVYVIGDLKTGTSYDYMREFKRSTGTWHHTKSLLPSDPCHTGCAALRIANCKLFHLQIQQSLLHIRVP
ncbi:LOW QUALITY PROTEIN: gigaxonin-like [Ctenodactylus gundi]